ncbi:flavin-containing monooxygenase [Novosphingobium pentaromativorans]|nr:NAD(P)/FAD-dependent oxidoreductase [Novosphingobium pentaromativorans]
MNHAIPSHRRPLRYAIIGGGMSGLLAGIKLKERGEDDFTIFEKAEAIGGTWRDNRYPGVACDTSAHSYTFSFAPNPDWSSYFAPGGEIRQYFERLVSRYGIAPHLRLNTQVTACDWREDHWRVTTADGSSLDVDVVIAASGVLHHPNIPEIPGLDTFSGARFHSAQWDDGEPMEKRRIGVIGNGSTGVQLVSALAGTAAHLVHFQRTPQWIMPCTNRKFTEAEKQEFRTDPAKLEAARNDPAAVARRARFTAAIIDAQSPELLEIQEEAERNLDQSVRDPALRELLRPDYRAACKRLVFSEDYYQVVQQPNVTLAMGGIERIEPSGVRMADGTFHELDVIVLATGFKTNQFIRPTQVKGVDGRLLDDAWAPNPTAYYAVCVSGFPNFFMLNGPTGPVGNFSLTDIAERQWGYIDQLIDELRAGHCVAISPSPEAHAEYDRQREEASRETVFASGCKSWYLDAAGVPQIWPWSYAHFIEVMREPCLDDFVLRRSLTPA